MCPFFVLTFIFSVLILLGEVSSAIVGITFTPEKIHLHENSVHNVNFSLHLKTSNSLSGLYPSPDSLYTPRSVDSLTGTYRFVGSDPQVAKVLHHEFQIKDNNLSSNGTVYHGSFELKGLFLGYTNIYLEKHFRQGYEKITEKGEDLKVSVQRDKQLIQTIFIISVATVVSISYINMGCALDMDEVYTALRRPVGPAIGLFSQYVCMPLISFALAQLLFTETYLKLGLFIFGCSPGGGASNMWAVMLGGNLNLSIAMTFLSTLLSFLAMPLWLYTLGRSIYSDTHVSPPARSILTTLGSMLIFLGIGLLIKKYFPKMAGLCRRILAPFSAAMIVFIIVFGTYANLYMFKVMTWKMFLATATNVWSGMLIGGVIAWMFRKSVEDTIAIAIETGVQNTGVSIVLLGVSLSQPDADLASAVPVSASIMTPIPLTIAYLFIKCRNRWSRKDHREVSESDGSDSGDSSFEKERFTFDEAKNGPKGIYQCANGTNSSQTVVEVLDDFGPELEGREKRRNDGFA